MQARGVVQRVKRTGPRTEPWGTPQESLTGSDCTLLTDTFWNRSYRYDLNQAKAVLWIPNVYSRRVRRMVWSIMSEAAERSRSVRSETSGVRGKKWVIYNVKEDGLGALVGAEGRQERMKEVVTWQVVAELLKDNFLNKRGRKTPKMIHFLEQNRAVVFFFLGRLGQGCSFSGEDEQ